MEKEIHPADFSKEVLNILFDHFHDILSRKRYRYVDFLLKSFDPKKLEVEICVGILTITAPWKEHLKLRKQFYNTLFDRLTYEMPLSEIKETLSGLQ